MQSVPSDITKCTFANDKICDTEITWKAFLNTVNPIIVEYGEGNIGNEDKRLGAYFVKLAELQNKSYFSEKVLMYLWNDAFKYNHEKIFKSEYKTLEQLIDGFKKRGFQIFENGVNFNEIISEIKASDINKQQE